MRQTLAILVLSLFTGVASNATTKTLCTKFEARPAVQTVVHMLAKKLSYTMDELCTHPRVLDIQDEQRRFFYQDSGQYETHTVITLHYSENSCEYHYNAGRSQWQKQYCYSTW